MKYLLVNITLYGFPEHMKFCIQAFSKSQKCIMNYLPINTDD